MYDTPDYDDFRPAPMPVARRIANGLVTTGPAYEHLICVDRGAINDAFLDWNVSKFADALNRRYEQSERLNSFEYGRSRPCPRQTATRT